uniref:High-affinity nickel-transporter n=1 Tax=Cyanothece sp. (strain PCC 7425 / ATCC 29141) TaxID=395961 RepID=B8HRN9_CYAP4
MRLRFFRWRGRGGKIVLLLLSCLTLGLSLLTAPPSRAHWSDLSVAEIVVNPTATQMTLTVPTGLLNFADTDRNGQLSVPEINSHMPQLQAFLADKIHLYNGNGQLGFLQITPLPAVPKLRAPRIEAPNTHTTLLLDYSWSQPVRGLQIDYNLFLAGVPTAHCLATILAPEGSRTFIFTPQNRHFALLPRMGWLQAGEGLLAIVAAFSWGAMHALSPGHGKTLVAAYLVGTRATAGHALLLGLTTTITHTLGVFALGLVTLFATQYILPEQIYSWLNAVAGVMVMVIGVNLLISRWCNARISKRQGGGHEHHSHQHHSHLYEHSGHGHSHHEHHSPADGFHPGHGHQHSEHDSQVNDRHPHHDHEHDGHRPSDRHSHSHLPGADTPVTWKSLLALGISGGLLPCPAALVLLLGTIALGRINFALLLVLAFSLGLAGVLTGLGLLLVFAKGIFRHLPTPKLRLIRFLPALSALGIVLVGTGITIQALLQLQGNLSTISAALLQIPNPP